MSNIKNSLFKKAETPTKEPTKLGKFLKENWLWIAFAIAAFFFTMSLTQTIILDYDYWFHYRAGEYFMQNFKVPDTPIGSWYAMGEGIGWISHEWMFGVVVYVLTNWLGQKAVLDLTSITLSATAAFSVWTMRKELKNNIVVDILAVLLISNMLASGNAARPQIFLYLFTIILYIVVMHDAKHEDSKAMWFVPALVVLWTNFHGGSYILIFVFVFASTICHMFDFEFGKIVFRKQDLKRTRRRLIALAIGALCIPLNGHGLEMLSYPFTNFGDKLMQSAINEWRSPDLKISSHLEYYIAMFLFFGSLITTKKEIKAFDFVFGLAFTVLLARSLRFGPQYAVAVMPIVMQYADGWPEIINLRTPILKAIAIIVFTVSMTIAGIGGFCVNRDNVYDLTPFPTDEMIEKVKEYNPQRLFNTYDAGGYLVYKHVDVFVDGRADIYSPHNLKDYLKIYAIDSNSVELLEKYNFDSFLIKKNTPIYNYITALGDEYKVVYEDENNYVFLIKEWWEANPNQEKVTE